MLEIRSIDKKFGDKIVLKNVSLDIPDKNIIGIYGPSGIGKSTLAKILVGIIPPDSGQVFLNDEPLYKKKQYNRKLGKAIQLVYQETYSPFDDTKTIYDAITSILKYYNIATKSNYYNLIKKAFNKLALDDIVLKQYPKELSGGEAKRVLICMALLLNPKVLILDEATVMLDPMTEAQIANLVKVLKQNMSIIWISHNKKMLDYVCDDIYCLKEGVLIKYEK